MDTSLATDIEKDPYHALVTAAKRGETHAFEKLMSRHKRRVFAVALRITKNREDAEDVVQESFHKAFLHLGSFQQASQFSTWLTRITFNEAYMVLRRRRRVELLSKRRSGSTSGRSPYRPRRWRTSPVHPEFRSGRFSWTLLSHPSCTNTT